MERTIAAQQKYEVTLKMVRESNAKAKIYRDATHIWPKPVPVRTPPEKHDWDFFYRSLQVAPETISAILTTMSSGKKPVLKSELRTQRSTTTLSERIGKKQHAMQAAIRKQRNVNAIIDTGAQVTTMPESAVNRMPAAHNHRDAPPGTAVKYGNGEIETIPHASNGRPVQAPPGPSATPQLTITALPEPDAGTATACATENSSRASVDESSTYTSG